MKEAKHCSYCGGLIDNDMKCTKCGHQYFNKEKDTYKVISFVLALLCCILLFWALENYDNYNRAKVRVTELESINLSLNERISELESSNSGSSNQAKKNVASYYYTPTGECYHKSNCSYLDNSNDVRQQSVDILEEMGYRKCSRCF